MTLRRERVVTSSISIVLKHSLPRAWRYRICTTTEKQLYNIGLFTTNGFLEDGDSVSIHAVVILTEPDTPIVKFIAGLVKDAGKLSFHVS